MPSMGGDVKLKEAIRKRSRASQKGKLGPVKVTEMLDLFSRSEVSYNERARAYGVSPATIRYHVRRAAGMGR